MIDDVSDLKIVCVLLGAGVGARARGAHARDVPKQFVPLCTGQSAFEMSMACLAGDSLVGALLPVVSEAYVDDIAARYGDRARVMTPVVGGVSRAHSVQLACQAIEAKVRSGEMAAPDLLLIHDSARPFVSPQCVRALVGAFSQRDVVGAVPVLPAIDTIKKIDLDQNIIKTYSRKELACVQTPQAVKWDVFVRSILPLSLEDLELITDDVSVLELSGAGRVVGIKGDARNFKLTTVEDFERANAMLAQEFSGHTRCEEPRAALRTVVASGFDIHAFQGDEGAHYVMLGGVRLPCARRVRAHSDGDVVLHALTDALLGVLGEGDIGTHFPPSDPKWAGAASDQFVSFGVERLQARGGVLNNVDITVLAEMPKIGPYRDEIVQHIARLLGLAPRFVSIKATTMEGIGAIGRREGLAAQVMMSVSLPD